MPKTTWGEPDFRVFHCWLFPLYY